MKTLAAFESALARAAIRLRVGIYLTFSQSEFFIIVTAA
jgi:hypothetical protein